MQRGKFIVFEGLDGSGKTTQTRLLTKHFAQRHWPVLQTSEPTPGPMGLLLRLILSNRLSLHSPHQKLCSLTDHALALLFAADRLDHLQQLILPQLEEGLHVICDRYYLSSLAYQMGDDHQNLAWLETVNAKALSPDLTLYLRASPAVCETRYGKQLGPQDRFHEREFLQRVAENYEYVVGARKTRETIRTIDGDLSEDQVFEQIIAMVVQQFPEMEIA